jgi:hypothetical protein
MQTILLHSKQLHDTGIRDFGKCVFYELGDICAICKGDGGIGDTPSTRLYGSFEKDNLQWNSNELESAEAISSELDGDSSTEFGVLLETDKATGLWKAICARGKKRSLNSERPH